MVEISSYQHQKRKRRGSIIPPEADELVHISARLRDAYRLVDEVGVLIRDRVDWKLQRRHRDMIWELRMIGENLNNRIDWMETCCGEARDD